MKNAIRTNFDESEQAYERYENATGRFAALADRLAGQLASDGDGLGRTLDAGAGNGHSTRVFAEESKRLVALDISRGMLRANPTADRVQADFDALPFRAERFDTVAFTASLFLTPSPETAAGEAARVLRADGTVGAVAPLGWTTPAGDDVFGPLERDSRSPTGAEAVVDALRRHFSVETGTWTFETTAEALRQFHAIPAMAARLYPRLDADARVERAQELLEAVEGPLEQRWQWIVGEPKPASR
ncbi:probable S-adenosylmethionine-dependent methyltransferase [Natronomonas pharaonis DSM 2160]|uniref:Probable S-adenosylmethionine-dependent methyltransferase n=1 Tax=Natronomonas pharaonis (strain ATCC 35678 / DSM 2160 / CIP 103997 / JCM 8858 / NBRC 14720 / NCIMB 2260 / Gabara) TaxID=348780 RepID=A0A1U7EYP2_NATPD|nr:class I SAM-dependent methyltransferase [Natronomonas pharaonis]CAI50378.2 probable S-adenosylmethionine-dependent methyltransferase [Natronomonas pharaonis DSM 2160]